MTTITKSYEQLEAENEQLRRELDEARDVIAAIRHHRVDAVIVATPDKGDHVCFLAEAEQLHRVALFENTNDNIGVVEVVYGDGGEVVDWVLRDANAAFLETLGLPLDGACGQRMTELFGTEAMTPHFEICREVMATGQRRRFETHFQPIDRDYRVSVFPLGKSYYVLAAVDITERNRLEKALQERADQLAESDRRKDEFLAMLGHELRNPLAGIVSGVQVLKMIGLPDGDAAEMAEVIERQADHMTHLVDDLLDVSRIAQGKIRLQKSYVNLIDLVQKAAETLGHGGRVTALSAGPGEGAEFTIRLPLVEKPKLSPAPMSGRAILKSFRILRIDDRRDAIWPLQKMLKLLGQEVETAGDGKSGLAKACQFRPEMILCDIGLPDMNGYEVAKALRAKTMFQSTYLVAVIGYGQEEDRRRAEDAGFDYHLAKPVSKSQLECLLADLPRFDAGTGGS